MKRAKPASSLKESSTPKKKKDKANRTPQQQAFCAEAGIPPGQQQTALQFLSGPAPDPTPVTPVSVPDQIKLLEAEIAKVHAQLKKAMRKKREPPAEKKKKAVSKKPAVKKEPVKRKPKAPEKPKKEKADVSKTVKFTNRVGVDYVLTRYSRPTSQLSDGEHIARLSQAVHSLASHNIKPTSKNIKALGIGAGTIQKFRPHIKYIVLEAKEGMRMATLASLNDGTKLVPYRVGPTSDEEESSENSGSDEDESDVDITTPAAAPAPVPPSAPTLEPTESAPLDDEWPSLADNSPLAVPLDASDLLPAEADPDADPFGLQPLPDLPAALAETMNQRPYLTATVPS